MTDSRLDLILPDALATEVLGAALAQAYVRGGRRAAVLYLHGDLGAGKTTCVRSLLRTLGVVGTIRSPTYTLVEVYDVGTFTCVHVDLYRLEGDTAVHELGLQDYLDDSFLLIEWPEKGATALPPADVTVTLSYSDNARACRLDASGSLGASWLQEFAHDNRLTSYVSNLT